MFITDHKSGDLMRSLSRREFLKSTGITLASLIAIPVVDNLIYHAEMPFADFPQTSDPLGRVTSSINIYDQPTENSKYLTTVKRDTVLPITQLVVGESKFPHNKIWYELDHQGFAHSGVVQPVEHRLNETMVNIPSEGVLGEVTVPYTDGVLNPSWPDSVVYRLYFGSTFWVNRIITGPGEKRWYRILDEEGYLFYVDSTHIKILEYSDIAPISPEIPPNEKRIEVHLQEQRVVAYERNKPVFMTRAATGAVFHTGNFSTPRGNFITNRKRPSRHMMDPAGSSYDLPGVPWVCYINDNGVAFHGTYWHNDFGAPRSHGCINLSNDAAKWLYRWCMPSIPLDQDYYKAEDGTRVDIW